MSLASFVQRRAPFQLVVVWAGTSLFVSADDDDDDDDDDGDDDDVVDDDDDDDDDDDGW